MHSLLCVSLFFSTAVALSATPRQSGTRVTRKDILSLVGTALVFGTGKSDAEAAAGELIPASALVDELEQVRAKVRSKSMNAKKVQAATTKTLEPLRNAMEKNPLNNEEAKLQPLLMKGHMLELDEALRSPDGFTEYISKTTKDTYPGGKVERELEEAIETAEEYCKAVDCDSLLVYR